MKLNETHYETHRFIEEAEKMGIEIDVISPARFEIVVNQDETNSIFLDGQPLKTSGFCHT